MTTAHIGPVTLGDGGAKVIIPVTGRTEQEVREQGATLANRELDIVEWRIDMFGEATDPTAVLRAGTSLVDSSGGLPLLCTFRTPAEGGSAPVTPDEYVAVYDAIIGAGIADAVDVELRYDRAAGDGVQELAHAAGIPVIGSWHNFDSTPPCEDIVALLDEMAARGFDVAKVAAMPHAAADVFSLLLATSEVTGRDTHIPVLTMAMGGLGVISRLAAPVSGSCATFAMVGAASAPGQVPVDDIRPVLALLEANLGAQ